MTIDELLERFDISKAAFGRELGFTTYAGTYKALNNPKQQPTILAYLEKKILLEKGIDISKIVENLSLE